MELAIAAIALWLFVKPALTTADDSGEGEGESMPSPFWKTGVSANGYDIDCLHLSLKALLAWADAQSFETPITATARTPQRQLELSYIGRTTKNPWTDNGTPLGPTVAPAAVNGYADPAPHAIMSDGVCHAFDFSYNSMAQSDRAALVAKAKELGLVWGGDWKNPDVVHIETSFWRQYR